MPDLSSSWSNDSISKCISVSEGSGTSEGQFGTNRGEWPGLQRHPSLGPLLSYEDQIFNSQSTPYPETHFTYGHPALIYNLSQPALSPSPEILSPTSQSVYASSDSSNSHFHYPVLGSSIPSQSNSPRPSPVHYTSHLPSAQSPFIAAAVHSPVPGSPTSYLLEQPYPALMGVDSPREQYVNLSDVASLGDPRYHSPYDYDEGVTHSLFPQEKSREGPSRGRKRGHEETDSVPVVPTKHSRGRPQKQPSKTESLSPSLSSQQLPGDDEDALLQSSDDGDSDIYIPSRSISPAGGRHRPGNRRVSNTSSEYQSTGKRRPKGTGAALSLRQLEELASLENDKGLPELDLDQEQKRSKRRNLVPVPNLLKKSRGRKVPVDQETAEDNQESGSAPSNLDLNSPNLFVLPDTAVSAYTLRSITGEGEYPAYEEGSYYHPDIISAESDQFVDTSQPRQGRPPRGAQATEDAKMVSGGIKKANGDRKYVCTAVGCGKCFIRGEHLKRHVRSLHTWDKRELFDLSWVWWSSRVATPYALRTMLTKLYSL